MVFVFCLAVNLVVSGSLSAVSSANKLAIGFSQSAYWIVAVPVCLVGVFVFNESLKSLWVCLAVFTMMITPITCMLLRAVDFN